VAVAVLQRSCYSVTDVPCVRGARLTRLGMGSESGEETDMRGVKKRSVQLQQQANKKQISYQ